MAPTDSRHAEERAALDAALHSKTFARSARLSQFLRYICEKSFEGEAADLKEYTIAVEAFGRPEEFDHTKDSIVRVEALRLRKKLAAFYEDEGADQPMRITVPSGGYVPVFERVADPAPTAEQSKPTRNGWLIGAAAALLLAAVLTPWLMTEDAAAGDEAAVATIETDDIRIMARPNGMLVDPMGVLWTAGRQAVGGELVERSYGDSLPRQFEVSRVGEFSYEIPLDEGLYQLALHFVEPDPDGVGRERRFRVRIDERVLLDDYNVLEDSPDGSGRAARVFGDVTPDADGVLRVQFESIENGALVNGIEVLATDGRGARPVRIVAGRKDYLRDSEGRLWQPDRFHEGGTAVCRPHPVEGTEHKNIYGGERWGDFRYAIPVAEGSYDLKLHFAETWFGPSNPGGGEEGERLFDVYCNGWPLLQQFDPYRDAGGENKALIRTFEGLRPGPDGRIVLEFKGARNFAMVNAIELTREEPETKLTRNFRRGGEY